MPGEKFRAYLALFEKEPSVFAAKDMDDLLRARFGEAGAMEIWDAFHNTWITETDFQLARALGFNFVRVPFWYRWFENDATPYSYRNTASATWIAPWLGRASTACMSCWISTARRAVKAPGITPAN